MRMDSIFRLWISMKDFYLDFIECKEIFSHKVMFFIHDGIVLLIEGKLKVGIA